MQNEKILATTRIDSMSTGQPNAIKLPPRKGGSRCRVASYHLRVLQTSGANARVTVELWHSPDGADPALHSTPINAADPGATLPKLLVGDANTSFIIGEFLHVVVSVKDSAAANPMWAVVELHEIRKPF